MDLPPPPPSENSQFRSYDEFFAPISAGIQKLVAERKLCLEKYYHEAPVWSLIFRHPKGGTAKVEISRREDGRVGVSGVWWKDDYDGGTRSLKWFEEEIVPVEPESVMRSAEAMLERILAHKLGAWSKIADGYKPIWHQCS